MTGLSIERRKELRERMTEKGSEGRRGNERECESECCEGRSGEMERDERGLERIKRETRGAPLSMPQCLGLESLQSIIVCLSLNTALAVLATCEMMAMKMQTPKKVPVC